MVEGGSVGAGTQRGARRSGRIFFAQCLNLSGPACRVKQADGEHRFYHKAVFTLYNGFKHNSQATNEFGGPPHRLAIAGLPHCSGVV